MKLIVVGTLILLTGCLSREKRENVKNYQDHLMSIEKACLDRGGIPIIGWRGRVVDCKPLPPAKEKP